MKILQATTGSIRTLTLLVGLVLVPNPTWAQHAGHDDHAGHDHGAESSQTSGDKHAGHDHGDDHDDHGSEGDGHEGHEGHGEEEAGVIKISPSVVEEYGIKIERANQGKLGQTLRLPGEVVFNADLIAHVTPSVGGIVVEVTQSVGDRVEAGDIMAVLNSRELASARSDYLAAKARLELAQENLTRDERLLKDKIGTERKVLESRQAVREAQIALNLAEQNLHALGHTDEEVQAILNAKDTSLSRYELRAPIGGLVIARHLTRGERVGEQPQQSPFVIADLSSVWVNLTVYQRDLARVQDGMPVQIQFGHGIPDASGMIAFVSPAVDEQTRTAMARVVLPNTKGQWRPGLFVTGYVALDESTTAAIVVPRTSLQTVDDKTVIFVQTDKGFEPRPVEVGRTNGTHAEILRGLEAGSRYVAANAFALKAEMNRASLEHAGHAH